MDMARSVQTRRVERAEEEVGVSEGKWESRGSDMMCFRSGNQIEITSQNSMSHKHFDDFDSKLNFTVQYVLKMLNVTLKKMFEYPRKQNVFLLTHCAFMESSTFWICRFQPLH